MSTSATGGIEAHFSSIAPAPVPDLQAAHSSGINLDAG
jgi:hypothetical protein